MKCIGFVLALAFCGLLVSGLVADEVASSRSRAHPSQARTLTKWTKDVRAALRREALAPQAAEKIDAIRSLIEMHNAIVQDARYATSPLLQQNEARLRVRLRKTADLIEQQIPQIKPGEVVTVALPRRGAQQPLAQRFGAGPIGAGANAGAGRQALGRVLGGVARDVGQELVELIEQTVAPGAWQVNGGIGTIYYFAPRQALVISAPLEVHEQAADLLNQLRAAGGP